MNTTMADGAEQRLDAQIAEALFGEPGMSKMDVANRVRELRGDGPALLVGGRSGGMVGSGDGLPPCPFCGHSDFDQWPCEYIDASGANVVRCARCHAAAPMKVWHAISAQTSPGGQGEVCIPLPTPGNGEWSDGWNACREAMLRGEGEALAARQPVDGCTESECTRCRTHPDHRGAMEHAGISDFRQPVGEPVFRERSTHKVYRGSCGNLPCHCWADTDHIVGDEVKRYATQPAQAVDLEQFRQPVQDWLDDAQASMEEHGDYDGVFGYAIEEGTRLLALIDGKAVGNG